VRLTLLAVVLWGCYNPDAPFGLPCSENGDCPDGQSCDVETNTCLPPLTVWHDDTADDFARDGAVLRDATIEPAGFIGPVAYLTGRFKLTSIASDLVTDPANTPWDTIASADAVGVSFARGLEIDYGTSAPEGLGLTGVDNVTVAVEGEVYLDAAGAWRFELDANDRAFVEVAPTGGDFKRVVTSERVVENGNVDVATPGWFRVRAAFSNAGGNMTFQLRIDPPNKPGGARTIVSDQMRARVDGLTGYIADGFAFGLLTDYHAASLVADPLDGSYDTDPYGIVLGTSAWSMRWSGQVQFDAGGDYVFHIESHRGHRMWIDGNLIANAFVNTDQQSTTMPIHLDAGWHDVVVDLTKDGDDNPSRLSVRVESGPAWVGEPIPADHVRPVMGRGVRWTSDEDGNDIAVPDAGSTSRALTVDWPANATPLAIATSYEIVHSAQAQMSVVVDPPNGGNQTILGAGQLTGSGAAVGYAAIPASDAGSGWTFIASDSTADAITGVLSMACVTITYAGGTPPFPMSFRYESAVHELGDVIALGALRYQLRQTQTALVQLRTCDTADACANEAWTEVANGVKPSVAPRRVAQYAVELATDGDHPTALDWIELAYAKR
jgi:hypothetical protein